MGIKTKKCREEDWNESKEEYITCKNASEVCLKHYIKIERKVKLYRNWIAVLALILVGTVLMLPYGFSNVDEDEFCREKISNAFPKEDNDYYAEKEGSTISLEMFEDICILRYKSPVKEDLGERRDGLILLDNDKVESQEQEKDVRFKLVEEADIKYLRRDDVPGILFIIGSVLYLLAIITLKEEILGW